MAKKSSIQVKDVEIKTLSLNNLDYLSITDIAKQKISTSIRLLLIDQEKNYYFILKTRKIYYLELEGKEWRLVIYSGV